jgi:hypothetical protein
MPTDLPAEETSRDIDLLLCLQKNMQLFADYCLFAQVLFWIILSLLCRFLFSAEKKVEELVLKRYSMVIGGKIPSLEY